jgi:hypothetical protein
MGESYQEQAPCGREVGALRCAPSSTEDFMGFPCSSDAGTRRRRPEISSNDLPVNEERCPSAASSAWSGGPLRPFLSSLQFNYPLPLTLSSLVPEPFQPAPTPSVQGGTFFTAANVNFYGTKKRRRHEMNDGKYFDSISNPAPYLLETTVQMNPGPHSRWRNGIDETRMESRSANFIREQPISIFW